MTYTIGIAPPPDWSFKTELVSEDYEWQIGELGGFSVDVAKIASSTSDFKNEQLVADEIKGKMEAEEGVKVTYIECTRTLLARNPVTGQLGAKYNVKCVFKGSPIAWFVVAGIVILVLAVLTVAAPVIWKYAGLSPEEVAKYLNELADAATSGAMAVAIVLVAGAVLLLFLFGGGFSASKKGVNVSGKGR